MEDEDFICPFCGCEVFEELACMTLEDTDECDLYDEFTEVLMDLDYRL